LQQYLADHGVAGRWETRERVIVAITGAPSGDALIRRAARMATRTKGELRGVRSWSATACAEPDDDHLAAQRKLLKELGGTYHEVVGDDVATTLVDFARAERGTQLILGATQRSRRQELTSGSVIGRVLRIAGPLDVHVIATGPFRRIAAVAGRARRCRPRRVVAWALLLVGAPALMALLLPFRGTSSCRRCCSRSSHWRRGGGVRRPVRRRGRGHRRVRAVRPAFHPPYGRVAVRDVKICSRWSSSSRCRHGAAFVDRAGRLNSQAQRSRAQVARIGALDRRSRRRQRSVAEAGRRRPFVARPRIAWPCS
jgi:nucleotide-binding universal stress UspA family protein